MGDLMKIKLAFVFSFLLIFILASCTKPVEFKGTFSTEPEKPKSGEKVLVKYDPANTVLKDAEKIKMFVYQYDVDIESSSEFEMQKLENGWTAEFIVLPETKGTIIIFAEDETQDNNDEKGYFIKIYDESGKELAGIYGGLGVALYDWGRAVGVSRNIDESLINFEKEFSQNTDSKIKYFDFYFPALIAQNDSSSKIIIEKELSILENKNEKSEEDLNALAKWYNQIGGETKSAEYEKIVLEKFPNGKYAEDKLVNDFENEKNIVKKKELLKKFEYIFPNSKQKQDLYDGIVLHYRNEKNFKEAKAFIHANYGKIFPFYYYSIASRWLGDGGKFEDVESLLKEGIKFSEEQIANPTLVKSPSTTHEGFIDELKYYAALNQFAFGELLYNKGEKENALQLLEKGVDNSFDYYPQQPYNELYAKVLIETGNYDKAVKTLEKFLSSGNGSSEQMVMLKEAYVKLKGNDAGFKEYVSKFEEAAKQVLIDKLKKEIYQEPAVDFSLKDMDGKTVSLSDYKGKTVVLDFWATWCGPCLKSFPGVKKAVEKYKDNESVKFLFVNTWERVDNKLQNAKDFISKNNYPFHVLMDTENKVVADYKVDGIPTKFLIDKNGNIRFKSVGFSGNTDQIVTEISEMIKMIN
ncbi:MAG: redoxin domain-containing protein [Melioribacteraceae bacterium]|nr:MAG: redoxin domain-containing protein [Melioribacteraceae bacterium]